MTPNRQLQFALKSLPRKTIGSSSADFPNWLKYFNSLLQSCYLECLTVTQPQTLPNTEIEWNQLDSTVIERDFTIATTSLTEGVVPFTDFTSTNQWITTVYFAIIKKYPDILITLYTILVGTLEEPLRYLIESKNVTATSFRSIYYGVIRHFVSTTEHAKALRLKKWLDGNKYSLNVPISTYDAS